MLKTFFAAAILTSALALAPIAASAQRGPPPGGPADFDRPRPPEQRYDRGEDRRYGGDRHYRHHDRRQHPRHHHHNHYEGGGRY